MEKQYNYSEISYCKHAEHFNEHVNGGGKEKHAKTWLEEDTVDAWRHLRMYKSIDPVLKGDPSATWLTVGDGRYGKDAKYIINKGHTALATDISDYLLKEAVDLGYIPEYRKENAESLSFSDSEFDYVFCKESYHHFPRPYIALYEMLRVANKGIVLIEPNDSYISEKVSIVIFRNLKNIIKKLLNKKTERNRFEQSGNYVYSMSMREMEKVALGLNLNVIAFKGLNDSYIKGVEYEKLTSDGPLNKKVQSNIKKADLLCRLGIKEFGLLVSIIFKNEPDLDLLKQLQDGDYQVKMLPKNPYA